MSEAETILIIDDHPVVLEGLSLMLNEIRHQTTLLTASNATEALELIAMNNDIDWLFIDINLPDMSGISLVKKLRTMNVLSNIILMSGEIEPAKIEKAMDLQINGVLSKAFDRNMFAQCFTSIELGKVYMSQEHADELKYYQQSQLLGERRFDKEISTRQYETLLMISKGFSNKEIAKRMDISESTVKSHVAALMTLFEADNRTHCVSEAQRLSII